jgi:hypothetical protein
MATVPLVGCLLGFIRYNFNPATIYLGDCGSLLIGFLLGSYAVVWSQKSRRANRRTTPYHPNTIGHTWKEETKEENPPLPLDPTK